MVCLGNICRSPMAEGIMRKKLEDAGIDATVDSAGTSNYHIGEHPDDRAIRCMRQLGIDISYLRARQFSPYDFQQFDYIFTMDENNHKNVLALAQSSMEKNKVTMMLDVLHPGKKRSVPDPWFGEMDGFFDVAEMLDEACERFVVKLKG